MAIPTANQDFGNTPKIHQISHETKKHQILAITNICGDFDYDALLIKTPKKLF